MKISRMVKTTIIEIPYSTLSRLNRPRKMTRRTTRPPSPGPLKRYPGVCIRLPLLPTVAVRKEPSLEKYELPRKVVHRRHRRAGAVVSVVGRSLWLSPCRALVRRRRVRARRGDGRRRRWGGCRRRAGLPCRQRTGIPVRPQDFLLLLPGSHLDLYLREVLQDGVRPLLHLGHGSPLRREPDPRRSLLHDLRSVHGRHRRDGDGKGRRRVPLAITIGIRSTAFALFVRRLRYRRWWTDGVRRDGQRDGIGARQQVRQVREVVRQTPTRIRWREIPPPSIDPAVVPTLVRGSTSPTGTTFPASVRPLVSVLGTSRSRLGKDCTRSENHNRNERHPNGTDLGHKTHPHPRQQGDPSYDLSS